MVSGSEQLEINAADVATSTKTEPASSERFMNEPPKMPSDAFNNLHRIACKTQSKRVIQRIAVTRSDFLAPNWGAGDLAQAIATMNGEHSTNERMRSRASQIRAIFSTANTSDGPAATTSSAVDQNAGLHAHSHAKGTRLGLPQTQKQKYKNTKRSRRPPCLSQHVREIQNSRRILPKQHKTEHLKLERAQPEPSAHQNCAAQQSLCALSQVT